MDAACGEALCLHYIDFVGVNAPAAMSFQAKLTNGRIARWL